MLVRFYTFTKKLNSTARPTGTYTEYDCVIKTSSDVITPTIELQMGLTSNPSAFNYCYIPDYNRYYWVKDWTFFNHIWIATLNVDVLATWKPYIGNTDMYVLRSSAQYDGSLSDNMYPTKADVTVEEKVFPNAYAKEFSKGFFVVGVFGGGNNAVSMTYYSMKGTDFAIFLQNLYSFAVDDDSIWGGATGLYKGARNAIFDVSSYIKSCKWYPRNPASNLNQVSSIKVGAINITGLTAYTIPDSAVGENLVFGYNTWQLPKHPQARSRGKYCNVAPFSRYKLLYMPFGSFDLNSALVGQYDYIRTRVAIDCISGQAILTVHLTNDLNNDPDGITLMTANTQFGVDIPIAVSSTAVPSIASGLAGAGISLRRKTKNWGSAIISGIMAITELVIPQLDSISNAMGSIGSVNYQHNALTCEFYAIADEDNDCNGRPLCKVRKPSVLGGYIEGEAGTFSAPATIDEMEDVKRFIENGFYYE